MSETLESFLDLLIGKECWAVVGGEGTGSVISLSIGDKIRRDRPSKNENLPELVRNFKSEFGLFIESSWRIQNFSKILCASHHENSRNGPYQFGFSEIVGHKIVSASITEPAKDLMLDFENNHCLVVHCSGIGQDNPECYSLLMEGQSVTVCFDGVVQIENDV